jgi:hypothetical protein
MRRVSSKYVGKVRDGIRRTRSPETKCRNAVAKASAGGADRISRMTPDGHLRHPRFAGLRGYKDPHQIVRE